jgi:Carboxypeptidase regulatory-like domain
MTNSKLCAALAFTLFLGGNTMVVANGDTPVSSEGGGVSSEQNEYGVYGRVTDGGRPVANASVIVEALDSNSPAVPEMAVMTNWNGEYFWMLPPGNWRIVIVTLDGKTARKSVSLGRSQRAVLDFAL